jgi:hypothetical protein
MNKKELEQMNLKYAGREVEVTTKYLSVTFPDASIFVGTVYPRKSIKFKKIPQIIKLLTLPHDQLEKEFLGQ